MQIETSKLLELLDERMAFNVERRTPTELGLYSAYRITKEWVEANSTPQPTTDTKKLLELQKWINQNIEHYETLRVMGKLFPHEQDYQDAFKSFKDKIAELSLSTPSEGSKAENNYVVCFLFDGPDRENVWLIEKQKPTWQKGCLNGIGGKIEEGETPIRAIRRELLEEANADIYEGSLTEIGYMEGVNNDKSSFTVTIFTGTTTQELKTMESEQVKLIPVAQLKAYRTIGNVVSLIEICSYRLGRSSAFSKLIMEY